MAKEQRGGVFTLGDVGERQETGSWNTASDVWLIASPVIVKESPFGYVGGGVSPSGHFSNIDRIDYSNDNTQPVTRSGLAKACNAGAGLGNLTHGYFAGGVPGPAHMSTVQRIDFANDTTLDLKSALSKNISLAAILAL